MDNYVTLTLEKYNELYDKAKCWDNSSDEILEKFKKAIDTLTEAVENVNCEPIEEEETFKFKKGDRVKCIMNNTHVPIGETGTVDENDSDIPWVNWDNGERWAIYENDIELIEESEDK